MGWITFLHVGFVLFVGTSLVLSKLSIPIQLGSASFYLQVIMTGLLAGVIGFFAGRRFYRWITQKRSWVVYTWLASLILLTILSFPQTFTYPIAE